jgi:hypothetical protein
MQMAPVPSSVPSPPHEVRSAVRELLTSAQAYHELPPETRRDVAQSLVRIGATAMALAEAAEPVAEKPPLALAQNAGQEFSGVAADRVASTTKQILNAVSFPRFVTELINGVFKAMVDSNQQQMAAFVDLIKNVAATTEGFADANITGAGAREYLADRFPGIFVVSGDEDDTTAEDRAAMSPEDRAEWQRDRDASTKLRLAPGAKMPTEAALRTGLGLAATDSVPSGDPEQLVPIARAAMARNRQQTLSTMVMLGLQRIVIDSGRIDASMRFHIDTRSAAADDRGSSFDVRNETSADVGAKVGPWGVNAQMKNTIGYVSTQRTQTTEEMNTDLDLNSSVELIFRTDYVPLERLAGTGDVNRIRVNSLNPDAEAKIAADERKSRREAQGKAEAARSSELDKALHTPGPITPPTPQVSPPAQPQAGQAQQGQRPQGQQGQTQQGQQGQTQQGQQGQTQQGQQGQQAQQGQQGQGQQGQQTPQGQTQQGQQARQGQQGQTQQGQAQQGGARQPATNATRR